MVLSLKYAGEGSDDLRIEKLLQSTKASEWVEYWEKKQLGCDLFQVPIPLNNQLLNNQPLNNQPLNNQPADPLDWPDLPSEIPLDSRL